MGITEHGIICAVLARPGQTSQGTQVTLKYQLAVAGFQSKTKLPFYLVLFSSFLPCTILNGDGHKGGGGK